MPDLFGHLPFLMKKILLKSRFFCYLNGFLYLIEARSFFRRSAMVAQSPAAISFGS